jgi:cell division initiation protein
MIEKAELEADSIIREANQQRQQIRQSILRLLDRREEIISGINSYLDIAQESLQQFSKDEASLFTLPKEASEITDPDAKNENRPARKKSEEYDDEEVSLKAQSLDDILDELD